MFYWISIKNQIWKRGTYFLRVFEEARINLNEIKDNLWLNFYQNYFIISVNLISSTMCKSLRNSCSSVSFTSSWASVFSIICVELEDILFFLTTSLLDDDLASWILNDWKSARYSFGWALDLFSFADLFSINGALPVWTKVILADCFVTLL